MGEQVIHIKEFDIDVTDTYMFLETKQYMEDCLLFRKLSNEDFLRILIGSALKLLDVAVLARRDEEERKE